MHAKISGWKYEEKNNVYTILKNLFTRYLLNYKHENDNFMEKKYGWQHLSQMIKVRSHGTNQHHVPPDTLNKRHNITFVVF